jgi:hypothetical protein
MPKSLVNYHVVDDKNIGDLMSSPLRYFDFPGFECEARDIRNILDYSDIQSSQNIILGGGGLLFERFLPNIKILQSAPQVGTRILWGAGQQLYGSKKDLEFQQFNYSVYTDGFHLVGVRDVGLEKPWVPCVSCMHPSFDKVREPRHPYVIFSHKKFQISLPGIPRMTNEQADMETILDFLGSGETILTSSFHGAYWGTLLGRKVLAFPFSSKFLTLKHQPALYPAIKWSNRRWKLSILGRVIHELKYENKLTCAMKGWRQQAQAGSILSHELG